MRYTVYDNDFKIEYEIGDCFHDRLNNRYLLIVEILENNLYNVKLYQFSKINKHKLIVSGMILNILGIDLQKHEPVNFETLKILYGQKT